MERQPYIYTLPEQFIADKSVPTHWRLWALINGFFTTGKVFYGTNEWVQERLGVGQWAVSKAFKKLEELGLITCERSRNNRIVHPFGKVVMADEGSDQTLPPQCPTTISDSGSPLYNSVSNSEIKRSGAKAPELPSFSVVKDSPTVKKTPPRDKEALTLREELYDIIEKERGERPTKNNGDYFRTLAALKRLTPKQVKWLVEDRVESGARTVREALTDRSIDIYLQDS